MTDNSSIDLGKRVKKDKLHPHGWQPVDSIEPDEACFVIIGGSNIKDSKKSNGFIKMVEELMKKKIPIYCISYNFEDRIFRLDREAILARNGQANPELPFLKRLSDKDIAHTPQYYKDAYQKILSPRLHGENGERISLSKISQRLNMLPFGTHCFGSTFTFEMEKLMKQELTEMGYSKEAQKFLCRQVHSVDVAPVIPYGKSDFSHFKIVSCSDDIAMSVNTPLIKHIKNRKAEHDAYLDNLKTHKDTIKRSPFTLNMSIARPTENEVVFATNSLYPHEIYKDKDYEGIEHTFDSYSNREDWVNKDGEDIHRSIQGDMLNQTLREFVNWFAEHAQENKKEFKELPSVFKVKRFARLVKMGLNNRHQTLAKEIALMRNDRWH